MEIASILLANRTNTTNQAGYRAYINSSLLPGGHGSLSFFVQNGYRETGLHARSLPDSFINPIPEPSTYALLAAGVAVLVWKHKRG